MALFSSTRFDDLRDLLVAQLRDLYDAEHRLCDALPQMSEAAHSAELREALDAHLQETSHHVTRLEEVFAALGEQPRRETCEAMKGLVKEISQVIEAKGDDAVRDAALIAAVQRVEHYEIAGYGTARAFAQRLGLQRAAELLQETLDEEGDADKKLTRIAEESINILAAHV